MKGKKIDENSCVHTSKESVTSSTSTAESKFSRISVHTDISFELLGRDMVRHDVSSNKGRKAVIVQYMSFMIIKNFNFVRTFGCH